MFRVFARDETPSGGAVSPTTNSSGASGCMMLPREYVEQLEKFAPEHFKIGAGSLWFRSDPVSKVGNIWLDVTDRHAEICWWMLQRMQERFNDLCVKFWEDLGNEEQTEFGYLNNYNQQGGLQVDPLFVANCFAMWKKHFPSVDASRLSQPASVQEPTAEPLKDSTVYAREEKDV